MAGAFHEDSSPFASLMEVGWRGGSWGFREDS